MPEWNPRANDLFVRAMEIEAPADRRLFVEQQCHGDDALRSQVESLLAAGGKIGSFLEKPAVSAPSPDNETAAYRPLTEGQGTVIGPYKLLQHIGEGGFGVVYMAEQETPVRRKVALKIIKLGMDTREVIARFESERQALAMMEHPNIARVFDAGATESGRPYFVMELVRGVPITEFCDKNRFSAEQRLKLFITVCNAIQHAHHKGIIHRDIKPSNVMVTLHDGVPVVKVIDFGVAKATAQKLTERTLFTAYGQMIGTPAYMSPEQAEMSGLDIDMQRLIREEEAPRPSTRFSSMGGEATVLANNRGTDVKRLSQLLRSDLDWIVMKSLEKDRTRRYGSPSNFAADVERYLTEQPVEARPPSTWYRFRKTARRNKAALTTVSLVAAALIAGTALSAWQAIAARRAEAVAVQERDEKEKARIAEAEQRAAAMAAVEETSAANEKLRVAQDRATRLLYVSQMNHASSALADNRLKQLQQILIEATPAPGEPDLRNWEWHYLNRLLRTDTAHKIDLGSGLRDAAFRSWNHISDNGQWAIRGRQEGEGVVFEVLETPTGKVMGRIPKTGTLLDVSKGNKDLWHFPVLSTDGRFLLLTEAVYQETNPTTPITRRPRMWEVATGMEVAAPKDPLPREMAAVYYSIVVGPGGEWVTWLDLSNAIRGGGSAGPIDVTIHRWEKAKGALPSKTVRVGSGWGRVVLGPDGRTLFWVAQRPNMPSFGDMDRPNGSPRFEVWDISDAPKLRWSINTLQGTNGPGYQPRLTTALSPSRTSVALLGTDDIAVHSIADGKLLWRTAFPEKRPTTSDVGYRISDDGERIVCTWDQTIAVLDRRTPGPLTRPTFPGVRRADAASGNERRILYRNRFVDDPPRDARRRSGQGETLSFYLLPDGKTLVGHDQARGAVRHWDLSPPTLPRVTRSGTQYEFVDGKRLGSAPSADGRLTARWGGRAEPTSVIVSSNGQAYGRIEMPAKGERAGVVQSVQFLDAGRRMLVTTAIPSEFVAQEIFDRSNSHQWFLFDIETENRFVKVAEGNGSVAPVPNSRYFWSSNSTANWGIQDWAGSKHMAGYVDIRDARTGRPVHEYRPTLPKVVATPGLDSFDPTGERVILLTGKAEDYRPAEMADPIVYVNPERMAVVEIATGKRLWGVDLTANGGTNRPGFVRFSPDGRYVLVLGTTPQREAYLTVYSATDGTKIWTADSYARGTTSGTRIIGFSPDGRFLAIGDGDAAEVRDMQSGKRIHRFTGHLDTPDSAVFTPDNTRLFVSFRWIMSARQAQPRLHVWDLTTGRELIALPSIQKLHRYEAGKLYGDVGVLDGSPLQP